MNAYVKNIGEYLRTTWGGLTLLGVCWLLFFSPILSGQQVYFFEDLKSIYYPLEQAYATSQANLTLPQWSNAFGFGQPLLSWGQLGFFAPWHLLLRLLQLPAILVLQIGLTLYFLTGLLGMFVFLRRKVGQYPAALGAIVYVFSGFNVGHLNHSNFYPATMLLPWVLVSIDSLLRRPTLRSSLVVSATAALLVGSGQPQVVLYTTIIILCLTAGLVVEHGYLWQLEWPRLRKSAGLALAALLLSISLAAIAILPVREFLPQTERNDALPTAELYEFSYPPEHAITLVFPHFFGDYRHYWGAKSYQELAGYVGIVPLLLAGVGLLGWHKHQSLRVVALLLLITSLIFTLGKYSPLYTWLIEQHLITLFSVPGRFIFFFDVAIALLSALGLESLTLWPSHSRPQRLLMGSGALLLHSVLFIPFFQHLATDPRLLLSFEAVTSHWNVIGVLTLLGLLVYVGSILVSHKRTREFVAPLLVGITALTLLIAGMNYYPRVPLADALQTSPFADTLRAFEQQTGVPARLYSAENILSKLPENVGILPTEWISPKFAVHQVIKVRKPGLTCLSFPIHVDPTSTGSVVVSLRSTITGTILAQQSYTAATLSDKEPLPVCFPELAQASADQSFIISFESRDQSPLRLTYTSYHQAEEPVYFVRTPNPTAEQLAASRKEAQLIFTPVYPATLDLDVALLSRHIQATLGASSARWIGALAIRNYREYVQKFFADSGPAIDGDGVHAIIKFRNIFNMSGVTHLIQTVPPGADDTLQQAGFTLLQSLDYGPRDVRLYANPDAYPKAFVVPEARFMAAADETRHAMEYEPFNPKELVYISSDSPNDITIAPSPTPLRATATITAYQPTQVDVSVTASSTAYLVVSDSTTEQWHTYIDGQRAPSLTANTVFKAAQVPAGTHQVSFRYESPAVTYGCWISVTALIIWLLLLVYSYFPIKRFLPS